ncbi:MAG: helix-turn-helix transcriptional regulator [Candidatus Hydrothermia bacterium]
MKVKFNIKKFMVDNRLSVKELAEKTKLSKQGLYLLLAKGSARLATIKKIEEKLNVKLDDYIEF